MREAHKCNINTQELIHELKLRCTQKKDKDRKWNVNMTHMAIEFVKVGK